MSRVISRKLLCIIIGVCLLPFIMDTLLVGLSSKGAIPGIRINAERFYDGTNTLAPRFLEPGDPVHSRYAVMISEEELRAAGGGQPALLVHRMNGEGYRVCLNGTLIGSIGDPTGGRANIWNATMVFPIDITLVRPQNEIVFDFHHEYNAGLNGSILLTDMDTARGGLGVTIGDSDAWSYISIGMLLSGCIVILMMMLLNQHRHFPYFFIFISLLALAVYTLDYIYIPYLPFSYLVFKKIIAAAMFISIASLSVAISMIFHKKLPVILGAVPLAVIMTAIVLARDIVVFARVYMICCAAIPLATAVWLAAIIPCFRGSEEARIFTLGLGLLVIGDGFNVAMMYLCPSMMLSSVFPFAFIYMSTMTLLMNLDIRRKNETIQQESSRRFHFYRKAITDGLTGLFNREYMISRLENENPPFAVAMLDIDHFKSINDNYGHQAGDRVMRFAAGMLASTLRDTDRVGRYGGDEFIVILHSSGTNAFAVMERFRDQVAHESQEADDIQFPITFSIGICYIVEEETPDQILRKADMALYMAKRNGRNRICVYEDE